MYVPTQGVVCSSRSIHPFFRRFNNEMGEADEMPSTVDPTRVDPLVTLSRAPLVRFFSFTWGGWALAFFHSLPSFLPIVLRNLLQQGCQTIIECSVNGGQRAAGQAWPPQRHQQRRLTCTSPGSEQGGRRWSLSGCGSTACRSARRWPRGRRGTGCRGRW